MYGPSSYQKESESQDKEQVLDHIFQGTYLHNVFKTCSGIFPSNIKIICLIGSPSILSPLASHSIQIANICISIAPTRAQQVMHLYWHYVKASASTSDHWSHSVHPCSSLQPSSAEKNMKDTSHACSPLSDSHPYLRTLGFSQGSLKPHHAGQHSGR